MKVRLFGKQYEVDAILDLLIINADGKLMHKLCRGDGLLEELIENVECGLKRIVLPSMKHCDQAGEMDRNGQQMAYWRLSFLFPVRW